jgi:hypothetical protein
MIELLHNYGLWLVLAGVFIFMHWFGMGCCGRPHPKQSRWDKTPTGRTSKVETTSGSTPPSTRSCH